MRRARRHASALQVRLEPEQLEQLKLDLVANLRPARKPGPEFVDFTSRFLAWARADRQKPSSIISKESLLRLYLTPRFAGRRLGEISDADILALKQELDGRSAKTVANVLTVLRKMLRLAVRWQELDSMPVIIDSPKVERPVVGFYDFDQYAQLLAGARDVGPTAYAMCLLAGDAGLRMGELLALEVDDVNLRRRELLVRKSEWRKHLTTPKGGHARAVPLTLALKAALERLGLETRRPDQRVLLKPGGQEPSYQTIRSWMRRVQRHAGMPVDGRLHVLRHTFCSHLAMRGAPFLAIRELAGHANASTTLRYMHFATGERIRSIGLLDQNRSNQSVTREVL